MKTNLIVVRAGLDSLHENWLQIPYEERDYDLVISYFKAQAFHAHVPAEGVSAVFFDGGKWDGLFKTFQKIDISKYKSFWLPDDDISISAQSVNEMFFQHKKHKLSVSQPSLTLDSFYSHFVFMTCSGLDLRFTNFIEIMAPCLSEPVLKKILPYFAETKSGYGLDYIWCRLPETGPNGAAILDCVQMHHTRPVGGELKKHLSSIVVKPVLEEEKLKEVFNLRGQTVPVIYAGVSSFNRKIVGRHKIALAMARGWLRDFTAFSHKRAAIHGILKTVRRQYFKKLDLRPLE